MKERGILFSAPMVRAILAGTKTQTRRIAKARRSCSIFDGSWADEYVLDPGNNEWRMSENIYGVPGDRLWVRETWSTWSARDGNAVLYKADNVARVFPRECYEAAELRSAYNRHMNDVRPSIHMPRWASRITLEITCVRVERLQDISEADAIAEGVVEHQTLDGRRACNIDGGPMMACGPIHAYRALWDSINGPGSWDANPWVWVIEFCRV